MSKRSKLALEIPPWNCAGEREARREMSAAEIDERSAAAALSRVA